MTDDFRSVFDASKKQAEAAEAAKHAAAEKRRKDYLALGDRLKEIVTPLYEEAAAALAPDAFLKMSDHTAYPTTRDVGAPALSFSMSSDQSASPNLSGRRSSLYVIEIYGGQQLNVYEGATNRNTINSIIAAKTLSDFDRAAFGRLLKVMSDDYNSRPSRR